MADSFHRADSFPGTEAQLLALAPVDLPLLLAVRFTAENERRRLADFAMHDRQLLRQIYDALLGFYLSLKPHYGDEESAREMVGQFMEAQGQAMISAMMDFGSFTVAGPDWPGMARTVHDLRGGAFPSLAFRLAFSDEEAEPGNSRAIYFLARDHLKIMRNAVCDLDEERFALDASPINHHAQLLVEKWTGAEIHAGGQTARVELRSGYTGPLCQSCLEFSSLDRAIYNLMNNAAKHTADGLVYFWMLPLPETGARSVRFVLSNAVEPAHGAVLVEKFGDRPGEIFAGDFTTGGNGLGMRICADFCWQAYGLENFESGLAGGYFGARWMGQHFIVWFHWPIALDAGQASRALRWGAVSG